MNIKRFALATLVGFIFVFIYDYVVHGIMLMPLYDQTPNLWRPMEVMDDFMPFMLLSQILLTGLLCFLYTRHHEGKGIGEGIRFGFIVGLLFGVMQASTYVWMPISATLALAWFSCALISTIALGIIFSLLYKD